MYQFKTNLFESEQAKRLAARLGWTYHEKSGEARKGKKRVKKVKNDQGDNKFRLTIPGKKPKDFSSDEEVMDHLKK